MAPDTDLKSPLRTGIYISTAWRTVLIELPQAGTTVTAEVNIAKASFWNSECREMISKTVGLWMRAEGHVPWPEGRPPQFEVEALGE